MIRKRIYLTLLMLAALPCLMAQNGFNMPYSQFGVGLSGQPNNMPAFLRTGGVALTRSGNNFVNPFNPASYDAVESESFVFDMGFNIQFSTLKNTSTSINDVDGNIGYLAIAMPITKWLKIGAGLLPYGDVNYESVQKSTSELSSVTTTYDGTGGVNQAFLGIGLNVLKIRKEGRTTSNLAIGANISYLTGSIERAITYSFDGADTAYMMDGQRYRQTKIGNILYDFGLLYTQELSSALKLSIGATFKPQREFSVSESALIYTLHRNDQSLVDTVFPTAGDSPEFESKMRQANNFGFGVSMQYNNQWVLSADVAFAKWQGLFYEENQEYAIFGRNAQREGLNERFAMAIEKVGNMESSTYWGRIGWSIGIHKENGFLYLANDNGEDRIDEWGIGAGLSMPMRKGRSLLTVGVGYSSMGSASILQRNCLTIGIGVSSCERWFAKRKYN